MKVLKRIEKGVQIATLVDESMCFFSETEFRRAVEEIRDFHRKRNDMIVNFGPAGSLPMISLRHISKVIATVTSSDKHLCLVQLPKDVSAAINDQDVKLKKFSSEKEAKKFLSEKKEEKKNVKKKGKRRGKRRGRRKKKTRKKGLKKKGKK